MVWFAAVVAAGVALLSPLVLNRFLMRVGIVDHPNERSSHVRPTLRGGGVAQVMGFIVGAVFGCVALNAKDSMLLLLVLGCAIAVGVLGLVEDATGVAIIWRAGIQLMVGLGLGVFAIAALGVSWWLLPVVAIAFAAYVNFANFMDGINGISSLHGLVVGSVYTGLGLILDLPWLTLCGALVAATFVTFLPWNLIPPGVFLGDVGSYLLGGSIAGTALVAFLSGAPLSAVIAPLSIYVTDTVTVVLGRVLRGEQWFTPHRGHVYQRLVDGGHSHIKIAVVVAVFSLLAGVAGLLSTSDALQVQGAPWVIIAALSVIYLGLPRLMKQAPREDLVA